MVAVDAEGRGGVRRIRPAVLSSMVMLVEVVEDEDEGARVAFERFVAGDGQRLRRALVARYGPEIGAEVAGDAFARAWQDWSRVAGMENPAGYLYRVAQSAARRYRRWARRPSFPPEYGGEDRLVEPGLAKALARLRPDQRVAVVLVHGYGCRYAEVAELTGTTVGAVRNHVHRGMARLRDELEGTR